MVSLAEQLNEQAVGKFRHCYLRYNVLLAQLQAEAPGGGGAAGWDAAPLLRHLQAGGKADALPGALAGGAAPFVRSYVQEVERLRLFLKSSLEALWLSLLDATAQLRGLSEELLQGGAASAGQAVQLGARLDALKSGFDATGQELVLLERFLRQNVAACAQLAQMYDQHQQGGEVPVGEVEGGYLAAAQAALLGELRLEPLIMGLSDAYELCRLIESDAAALAGSPAHWVPPDRFQRVTRKFWVHPADVVRFKTEVIKHLPVLIFGDRQKLTEGSPFEVAFLRDQTATDSADVSSVYYDNPASMPSYHVRLRKDDMASVVRLRWYGERAQGPQQRIFVERKVHRERYTGERSYKERAPIEQRYVEEYTSGSGGPLDLLEGSHAEFLQDAQHFLVQGGQVPMLRTCYRRTAFQESSNNMVRISLDTELHSLREEGAPRAPGDWCRDASAPLPPEDVAYFPYAVVEIKLQEEPPAWVQGLLATGMLLPVPKFSKFLHGTAVLFQSRCLNVPYWFLPDEHDSRLMTPATWEEMADPADEFLQKGIDWLLPRRLRGGADADGDDAVADEPPVPYNPSPLRFLRRNKTVPVAGSNTNGDTAEAAAFDWRSLQVAGGVRRLAPAPAQAAGTRELVPPPLFSAPALGAPVPLLPAQRPEAQQVQQQQQQQVVHPRNYTWPVYQNPMVPGSEETANGTVQQSAVQMLAAAAPPAPAAAVAPGAAMQNGGSGRRPGSPQSQSSTPHDSAQDLESGQSPEKGEAPAQNCKAGPGGGGKPPQGGGTGGAAAGTAPRSSGPCFGALQYRLPSTPACANGSGPGAQSPTGRAKALVRTRVEPKTFFANERTFLQWLQISVLIMMTATSLLSGSGLLSSASKSGTASCSTADKGCFASKLSGAIIAPVALLFMAYALYMYKKRTYQILRRETVRYDDQRGPVVLVVILLAVFLLAYVLAMTYIF